jgi:hypothetical protein
VTRICAVLPDAVTHSVFGGADHFFTAIGPNSTTFLCAAEIFPFRAGATADGIAAAAGKLGLLMSKQPNSG